MFKIILVILIFALIIGGVYIYYEKPAQEVEIEFVKLNIFAKHEGNLIKTDYKIFIGGNLYSEGQTSNRAGIEVEVPMNKTVSVYNSDKTYYTSLVEVDTKEKKPYRINLILDKPGELNISKSGTFGVDKIINLSIKSFGINKDLVGCIKWSSRIIRVKPNLERLEPKQYKEDLGSRFSKCFKIENLNNNEVNLELDYDYFGTLEDSDYILLKIIGYDKTPYNNEKLKNYETEYKITI